MKRVSISGSLRENVGKKDAKQARNEGKVICVLYGGKEQIHFTLPQVKFDKLIYTPEVYLIDIDLDGTVYPAIIQDMQFHPVTDKTLHVDFLEIVEGKPVTVSLPVKLTGTSPGVMKGGILTKKMRNIAVKGIVHDMPENITLDISKLEIADSIKIKDVDFGALEPKADENAIVVNVKTARGVLADEEEEEGEEGEAAEGEAAAE